MQMIKESPVLVAQTSRGGNKFWVGRVVFDGADFFIQTEYWQTGSEHIQSVPRLINGKNVGRANETTPKDQAIFELESLLRKQRDKGYAEEGETREGFPLPMLAHKFTERGHDIKWPAFIQPKLDGIRILADGKIAWTRLGKTTVPKVMDHLPLEADMNGMILDGELILPQESYTFQDTISATKRFSELSPKLNYWIFDCFDPKKPEMTFQERIDWVAKFVYELAHPQVIFVPTILADDIEEVKDHHQKWVEQGYEGTIIRNIDAPYKVGHRSADLQKYKDFQDDEFIVVDVEDGKGKEAGCAIFVCALNDSIAKEILSIQDGSLRQMAIVKAIDSYEAFRARPRGTVDQRRNWFDIRRRLINKNLTVRYQELHESGIPRFPVGIAIREGY